MQSELGEINSVVSIALALLSEIYQVSIPRRTIMRFTPLRCGLWYRYRGKVLVEPRKYGDHNPLFLLYRLTANLMKKFFYYSCGISAIVVAACAIVVTVYVLLPKKNTFNVNIEGKRNYVTYKITGKLPPNEVVPFVKKKTDELNPRNDNQRRF